MEATSPNTVLSEFQPSRRSFLLGAGSFVAWANAPRAAFAGVRRDPRLIVMILRGALDGLAIVPPVADKHYAGLRGELAVGADGKGALPLDGFFALNDAMPNLHRLYAARQALVVHAVATPYRERSHFDGQDVLESGQNGVGANDSGWLNRVAASLPSGAAAPKRPSLAIGTQVPLIFKGPAPILTWQPPSFTAVSDDTLTRLASLYGETDPAMSRALEAGRTVDALSMAGTNGDDELKAEYVKALSVGAGHLLAAKDGPRIAAISYTGWDTHAFEGAEAGRLAKQLSALDGAIAGLKSALGPAWGETAVVIATEFGRTVRINGSKGTDHGTGTMALLVGGAVKGGRVICDWPGLSDAQLLDNRDLKPTLDLRAVFKGVLRDHLQFGERLLATRVFPDSLGVKPVDDLIA